MTDDQLHAISARVFAKAQEEGLVEISETGEEVIRATTTWMVKTLRQASIDEGVPVDPATE